MNLVIDAGNTNVKLALFDGKELTKKQLIKTNDLLGFERFIKNYSVYCRKLIFSSVGDDTAFLQLLQSYYNTFVIFNSKSRISLQNDYKTPETLGLDRIAAAVGAAGLFPGKDVLVFDAGSCLTWDFVAQGKIYKGGGISPGLNMRLKSLHTFTARLPLVKVRDYSELLGQDTESSIIAGTYQGMICEIEGIIHRFQQQYPVLKVIFTGGDANYFDKKLKNNIFAHPNLVLQGLNIILDLNA